MGWRAGVLAAGIAMASLGACAEDPWPNLADVPPRPETSPAPANAADADALTRERALAEEEDAALRARTTPPPTREELLKR